MLVQYDNVSETTLEDVVVIFDLPPGFTYESSTNGGFYRDDRHQVFWKLGDLTPGNTGGLSVTSEVPWGLPFHLDVNFFARIAARNMATDINVDDYLNYVGLEVVSEKKLSTSEINSLLSANDDLKSLFDSCSRTGIHLRRSGQAVYLQR